MSKLYFLDCYTLETLLKSSNMLPWSNNFYFRLFCPIFVFSLFALFFYYLLKDVLLPICQWNQSALIRNVTSMRSRFLIEKSTSEIYNMLFQFLTYWVGISGVNNCIISYLTERKSKRIVKSILDHFYIFLSL